MANKKYSEFTTGTGPVGTKILLIADPSTGELEKVTLSELSTFFGGGGGGDTTAPTVTTKTVENATPNKIDVVFSESVTVTTAGWSAKKNGSAWSISSVTGSGTAWSFTMGSSAANGDTLLISYDSTTGATVDGSSNELVTFTDSAVTNNVSASYDADAVTFFTAAGITDTTQKNAVNTLVLSLKADSIWAKMLAIYPMVGGTSGSHAVNLKAPGTYDITFTGSWTHSSTGAKGDGSTAYGKISYHYPTLINASTLSINDYHHSYYGRQSYTSSDEIIIGANGTKPFYLNAYSSDNIYDAGMGGTAIDTVVTPPSYTKLLVQTRTSSTVHKSFRDGTQLGSTDTTASGVTGFADSPTNNVTLNAMGSGSPTTSATKYCPLECAFASLGKGLTDTDVTNLTTAVNTYQTSLSRNV